jgi:hypothetical protein
VARHGLAAYSCGGSCGIGNRIKAGSAPHSLFALVTERPSIALT